MSVRCSRSGLWTSLLGSLWLGVAAAAQMPTPGMPAPQRPAAEPATGMGGAVQRPAARPGQPRPYSEVIPSTAKSLEGLFKVHRVDEKLYFEIPPAMFGRDMLWQTEIAEISQPYGYPGAPVNHKLVRWTRRNQKVYLRTVDYSVRAQDTGALQMGVEAASLQPIVMAFNVEAEGPGGTTVIDVTSLFTTDPAEFSVRQALQVETVDPGRSYVDRVSVFPTNIETRSLLSFSGGGRARGVEPGPRRAGSGSALVHYSLVLLPETPMRGRLRDPRVGYFATGFTLYGSPRHRAEPRQYISRFRLEKKDPNAPVSEPVRPIVFYISREVPEKWRPWIRKGVEDWQPAFEQAGFARAILCRDAPSRAEDPEWDPEDARYSVIRWAPSPIQNAMGPHVADPRSGETLSAHIIIWHNILQLLENWYFVQAAPLDSRAQRLPLPDDLMGELVRYVTAHEVGHTLGLEHNFKASAAYTVAQLRDPNFTARNGLAGSIMDYARFNYVAQPGDGARLIGGIGPYDRFAIEWGYRPIPQARTPEEERPFLDALAARQVTEPALRFGNYRNPADPTEETEDLADDPIEATRLGLRNIRRAARLLLPATTRFGEDYSLLTETYEELCNQRLIELLHVARLVGGVVTTDFHAGRGADVYRPVPAARQADAVRFLMAEGLEMPRELMDPAILNRITAAGALQQATESGRLLLATLLAESRIRRMLDNEARNGARAYTVAQLLADIRAGVWRELASEAPVVPLPRRELQRVYLGLFDRKINGPDASDTELKSLAREELRLLARRIDERLPRVRDTRTRLHLAESRKQIERILSGKTPAPAALPFVSVVDLFGARPGGAGCYARTELLRTLELDGVPARPVEE